MDNPIETLRQSKANLQDRQHELRESMWELKKSINDPHISPTTRASLEDSLFSCMEAHKQNEEMIVRLDERIAELQRQEDMDHSMGRIIAGAICLAVIVFCIFVILSR